MKDHRVPCQSLGIQVGNDVRDETSSTPGSRPGNNDPLGHGKDLEGKYSQKSLMVRNLGLITKYCKNACKNL